ncbi:hypothetical protein E2C01_024989 [Portunus trituberculatus]|uniref:Uncharacterized protein n=1 Tax=Portunus trituberculatus TaxID=210409 RepID=A0A5B7EBV7_PORTR|nr:hypothetical protein [Portunus trituberculatus]
MRCESHNRFAQTEAVSSSHSPESGIGLSHNSLPGSDTYDQPDTGEDENGEFYDTEPLPIIGTCRAIYIFEDCPRQHPVLFLKALGCKGGGGLCSAIGLDLSQNWMKVEDLHLCCIPCTRPLLGDVFHLDLLNISSLRQLF